MNHSANDASNRDAAFASARFTLERAHKRQTQARPHRAINHLTMDPYLLLQASLLPALFCGLLVWAQPNLFEFWREFILVWGQYLDLPLAASTGTAVATKLGLSMQSGNAVSYLPSGWTLLITTIISLAAFAASFRMNGRMFPLKYLVRILCVVQGYALLFFWLQPSRYPYNISNHANELAHMGYVLLLDIPVMLALGYYVLNIGLSVKIFHTALILLYFVILVPFQIIAHVLMLQHGSLLFMPVLYICFGTLFDMLIFVALYSWAASNAPAYATT